MYSMGLLWIPVVLIVVGGLFLYFGIYLKKNVKQAEIKGKQASATVMDYAWRGTIGYPIVKYKDGSGHEYTGTLSFGTNWVRRTNPIGSQMNITYDPDRPDNIIETGGIGNDILPIIFIVMGSILAGVGFLTLTLTMFFL